TTTTPTPFTYTTNTRRTSTDTTPTPTTSTGTTETPTTSTGTTETPTTSTGTTNTPAGGTIVSPEQPSVPTAPTTPTVPTAPTDAEKLNALNPVLNTKTLALTKGGSATLSVAVTGSEPYTVEWSSNSPIASVSNGVVTGVETGTAMVTATVRVGSAAVPLNCTVTVTETAVQYTAVKIEGSTTVQMGSTGSVKGTTTPEGGSITWTSDNTGILTIDNNG
ncbi:MAG: Ig-like domain-containing protein, partial [Lachnospiraceae bacterium]|nr:Ig-like domain-containing protein [Lachnospiraceae bacterium]